MIPRSFEDIAKSDIEALIANRVAERRTLEFKRELPGTSDKDRKEFLADLTSFANAQGGDILFGIDAPKGVATTIAGMKIDDPDKEVLRWEEVLLAGVEPRLPGIKLRWIDCGEAGGVMLIRVPASTIAPHRVIFARTNRFFGRKSNGKYEMDTQELRDAFTASEALPTRLRALHLEAVDAALRGDLPIILGDDPTAIVSLIPATIFREARDLDVTPEHALAPHKPSGHMEAIRMIEGVLLHANPGEQGAVRSYAITHRTGRTDMVWTIGRVVDQFKKSETKLVWPKRFEDGLLDAAISGASWLNHYGIDGPWLVMATITSIKDYRLVVSSEYWSDPAWRNLATLPPLMIERMNRAALLPLLRSFWLAFGFERPASPFGGES
jgi:Putative DNA-binding domain